MTGRHTQITLIHELNGKQCRCNRPKQKRKTFCAGCYYTLPDEKRKALYNRIGEGYEEAYQDAVDYLTDKGRIDVTDTRTRT